MTRISRNATIRGRTLSISTSAGRAQDTAPSVQCRETMRALSVAEDVGLGTARANRTGSRAEEVQEGQHALKRIRVFLLHQSQQRDRGVEVWDGVWTQLWRLSLRLPCVWMTSPVSCTGRCRSRRPRGGHQILGVWWVDVKKADGSHRSLLVAKAINMHNAPDLVHHCDASHRHIEVLAAPSCSGSGSQRHAHRCGSRPLLRQGEDVYVKLPVEDQKKGEEHL